MRTRRGKSCALALAMASTALVVASPVSALAQDVVEEEVQGEEVQEENPFEDFERFVEGAEVWPGFFDLYTKEGRLYLAVPHDRLGQDFLMDVRVARGIGAAGLFGGTTPSTFEMDLMAFEKHGENVSLSKDLTALGPRQMIGLRPPSASASDPPSSRAPMSRLYVRTRLLYWR